MRTGGMLVVALPIVAGVMAAGSTQAPERPRISGIAHVAFRVSSLPEARAFYGGVLALQASTARGENGGVTYRVNDRQAILLAPGLRPDEDERLWHVAYETSDLDALAAYLESRGVRTSRDSQPRCAARALWASDPDGHLVEFVERVSAAGASDGSAGAVSARLLHAGVTVRDPQAADAFYKDVLGFAEIWRGGRTDTNTDWINMKVPEGTDYLEYMLVSGPVDRRQLGVLHHVALLVPDIQEAYEAVESRMDAAGRARLSSPQVGRNKRWQLNLYDPDGTRTELMEPFTMR
jgi:catechol 2,3-dioxygenase-like lactoylglutathione lyase family enzyme